MIVSPVQFAGIFERGPIPINHCPMHVEQDGNAWHSFRLSFADWDVVVSLAIADAALSGAKRSCGSRPVSQLEPFCQSSPGSSVECLLPNRHICT